MEIQNWKLTKRFNGFIKLVDFLRRFLIKFNRENSIKNQQFKTEWKLYKVFKQIKGKINKGNSLYIKIAQGKI